MKSALDLPQKINARVLLLLAGILIATFLSFSPTLKSDFTNWDDKKFILENPYVQSLDAGHIWGGFTTRTVNVYVPLTLLTFNVEHHFFGFDPFVFHLDNLLLHMLVTSLVLLFLLQLGLPVWVAGFSALVFGVHPLHVESVAWVTERKDVLYASFYLLAMILYVKYLLTKNWGTYALSVAFGLLSILAKPMALSLPLILLFIDWLKGRTWSRAMVLDKLPFAACIVGITLITYLNYPKGTEGPNFIPSTDIFGRLAIWLWTFGFYVQKFFAPAQLVPYYYLPEPISLWQAPYLLALATFLLCVGIALRWSRDRRVIFGLAYFLGSIFFVLRYGGWINYTSVVADRFIYLPCLGLCLLAGLGCHAVVLYLKERGRVFAAAFLALLACVIVYLAGYTFRLTHIWNSSLAFWTFTLENNPQGAPRFLALRGYAYLEQGQIDLALADAERAVKIGPGFAKGYALRGLVHHIQGDEQAALSDLDRSIQLNARSTQALIHRATVLLKVGSFDLAILDCDAAIALDPDYALAFTNRGQAHQLKGDLDAALQDFDRAIFLSATNYMAYYDRASIYFAKKAYGRALSDLDRAIALNPQDHVSFDQRGSVYYLLGKLDFALQDYDRAVSLHPDDGRSYNNRGSVYLAQQKFAQAREDYTKAIALDANDGMAYFNRSITFQAQDDYVRALEDALKARSLGYVVDEDYVKELRDKAAPVPAEAVKRNGKK